MQKPRKHLRTGLIRYNTGLSLKSKLLLKYSALIAALKAMGAWGVLVISALDASAFGIPMDPLIAGFVYANPHKHGFIALLLRWVRQEAAWFLTGWGEQEESSFCSNALIRPDWNVFATASKSGNSWPS